MALSDFPKLKVAADRIGFSSIDVDGVYRSYDVKGTVVDAARLSKSQIATYLMAIADSPITAEELAYTQSQLESVDSSMVAEVELINPPVAIKPMDKLASFVAAMAATSVNLRGVEALFYGKEKRQYQLCTYYGYCNFKGGAEACAAQGCYCNGVFCQ